MGIATTKSFADINEGTQIEVEVADATYDEEGRFGPAVELALDVHKPSTHAGDSVLSTFGLSQPRRSKVRDLRADGLDDEAIATVLENKNFEFETIDDPETPKLGGALLRIVKACYNADARAVKKLLEECDTFDELADALIGRRFVATTRKDKNEYTRIDGKGEFYRVMPEAKPGLASAPANGSSANEPGAKPEVEDDGDWEDIPF
jgi:hypothetical protein